MGMGPWIVGLAWLLVIGPGLDEYHYHYHYDHTVIHLGHYLTSGRWKSSSVSLWSLYLNPFQCGLSIDACPRGPCSFDTSPPFSFFLSRPSSRLVGISTADLSSIALPSNFRVTDPSSLDSALYHSAHSIGDNFVPPVILPISIWVSPCLHTRCPTMAPPRGVAATL